MESDLSGDRKFQKCLFLFVSTDTRVLRGQIRSDDKKNPVLSKDADQRLIEWLPVQSYLAKLAR